MIPICQNKGLSALAPAIPRISSSFTADETQNTVFYDDEKVKIIYTGAIDELFGYKFGVLPYRSLHFDFRSLHTDSFQNVAIVAYPQTEGYTRITEYTKMPCQNCNGWTNVAYEFPITVADLFARICDICNVISDTDISLLPNYDYVIQSAPATEDLTYRQLLSWIAEITGSCGFIDWNGRLILKWYSSTDTVLDLTNRFVSDLEENAIEITGVQPLRSICRWPTAPTTII